MRPPSFQSGPPPATRPSFVDALVLDLKPVRVARTWRSALLLWLGLSWVFVASAILISGPIREGALRSLLSSPQAGFEAALGLAAGLSAVAAALEIGVPGAPRRWRLLLPTALFMTGWFFAIAYGINHPAFETSMLGKREHCFLESLVFATPPYFLALRLLRERIPGASISAGLLAGAASAAVPALWMQIACMQDPIHALQFHLTPILALGLAGALLAHFTRSGS